ncbi:hypothetical protein PQX77_009379 [Marasmius sp. AFHP31]|nr:hypothetical protein PQX77_009379 [Marasmius sp. AFHP31]
MAVSLEIVPTSSNLDMYGKPDPHSAYSLSGHVLISVSPSYFHFSRNRKTKLLLQSLDLTFEGQTEVYTPLVGYSSTRLCHITKDLAPQESLLLSNDGHKNTKGPCQWSIVFNLTIPGWLPRSSSYGPDEKLGVSYSLYATAKFLAVDMVNSRDPWSNSISSLYSSIWSPERTVHTDKKINLRRFISTPSTSTKDPVAPSSTFYINPQVQAPTDGSASIPFIPVDVWSKVQILVSVPEYVDMKSDSLPFTLRMRTKGMSEEDRNRMQFMGFTINVVQKEKCRKRPSSEFAARFPLPPDSEQPPNLPLRKSAKMAYLCDGLYVPLLGESEDSRSFSLLSSASNGQYQADGRNYIFADNDMEASTWFTLQCAVPLSPPDAKHNSKSDVASIEWAGDALRRPSSSGPLLTVRHQVSVKITLGYDSADHQETAWEAFMFNTPLRFENVAPRLPTPSIANSLSVFTSTVTGESISLEEDTGDKTTASEPVLPPYSELFDMNGDRKLDPTPLPLYSPPGEPEPAAMAVTMPSSTPYTTSTPSEKVRELNTAPTSDDEIDA